MKKALLLSVTAGLLSLAAGARAQNGLVVTHHELLETFEIGGRAAAAGPATTTLTFDALGRRYDLELEPNTRLLPASARQKLRPGIAVYRGQVAGIDGSWARIVIADGVPSGMIWNGSEMLAIEAPGDSAVAASSPVIYRLKDTYIAPGTMSCGTDTSGQSGATAYNKLVGELETVMARSTAAADLQLDLGVVGDFELFQRFNSETEEAILTRLNIVDGIYSEQLGVQLRLEQLDVFTTASDPFTDESEAGALLDELALYRRDTVAQRTQGLTHLYTGRDLDGTTVGIAFLNELCDPRFGVGLSEGRINVTLSSLVAAHEIGHNFGALHDGEPGVCESTPETFLMAPNVNDNDQFSQCSIDTITPNIAAASCINPPPTVDMRIGLDGSQGPVLLGADASLTFTASNSGSDSATGVEIDISLPNNVTFQSASTEFGTCTSGAGSVNCTYGTVPGNGTRAVTVVATASTVGSGTFTATVSADTDVDPANNDESVTLIVEPAVDLVVNSVAAAQTEVDEAVVVIFDLENRSVLGATGVELSISLNSGLRADAASWPLGGCTVTDQQVDCTTDDFAAQSDATLDLTLTGVTNGSSNYTVSLSSAEADANTSNNSITATVQVGPVTMPGGSTSSGGGGGSTAPISLLFLATCAALATARRRPRGDID